MFKLPFSLLALHSGHIGELSTLDLFPDFAPHITGGRPPSGNSRMSPAINRRIAKKQRAIKRARRLGHTN